MKLGDFKGVLALEDEVMICFIPTCDGGQSRTGESGEWVEEEAVEG